VRELFADLPERWDGKGPRRRRGLQVPLALRISQVARDAAFQKLIGGTEHARSTTSERSGRAFDPAIAAPVVEDPVGLLDADETVPVWDQVLAAEPGGRLHLVAGEVDQALSAMADFADLVSPHLTGHSRGVADLAGCAAELCGMSATDALAVRRAGLVHDLGRVAVHAAVWSSTGPLSQDHWEQVRLHAYHSERVLSRSPFLSTLRDPCAGHHERLDGSGYHRGTGAGSLSLPARLLAAADVAHALSEPRAHRPALLPEHAADLLAAQARDGRLDPQAVDAVLGASGRRLRAPALPDGLTAREAEVIALLAHGLQTKQVARRLAISPKTADRHVQNAYAKIGVSTRASAAVYAMQHGLLPWGELPMSESAGPS
jgi:HD-GYP domain-containing protein (c-di-GMP phosphodiesterase class II)